MKQFTLSSLLLLWGSWQCLANNYYLSNARGDDSRSPLEAQNPQTPWRTTAKLNAFFAELQPGDSILFKRGEVFFGTIQTSKSGSPLSPIVIGAYGQGEKPVISGFTTISNWKSIGGGIYESPVLANQSAVNLVVINGINQAMGRYPNANAVNKGYLNFESHGSNFIVDNQLSTSINWSNAELVLRSTRYTIDKVKITSHSKKQLNFSAALPNGLMDGYGYFVQNHLKTLDKFGEWFYNPSTKKLNVFLGSNNAANFKVEVGTIDVLIEPRTSNLVIDNLTIRGANRYGVFCDWSNLHNLKITNSQILYSGIDAIQLSGRSNFVLENCSINYSNSKAVNLNYNNPHAVLKNNSIRNSGIDPGMILGQAYGIVSYTKGLVAQNNTIINTGYAGIRFFGDSNLIKNNLIDTFCTILDDGAGIYTWTGGNNTLFFKRSIIGNIVLNGLAAPEGTNDPNYLPAEGIYLDDNSTNVEVFDNTVANCKNNGIFIHNSRSLQIQNNLLFNNGIQLLTVHDHLAGPVSDLTVTDNQFFSKKQEQVSAYYKSLTNDFASLGNFSGNYYARPFDDDLTIISEYDDYSGNRKKRFYDVKSPQLVTGSNQEAGGSPLKIKPYKVLSVNESLNKYPNGGFETSPINVYCWSADGACRTTWSTTSALDQRAMKITGSTSGLLALECGAVTKTKQYILRFSAIGQVETHIEVFLRQVNSPWKTLSTVKTIRITPTRTEYEVLFSFPASETAACIMFQAASDNFSYWLDNVKLMEASASMVNPDDHIRFEYNPTLTNKTIQLGANYLDVEKRTHSGELVLKPFESIVLVKVPQTVPIPVANEATLSSNFRTPVDESKWLIYPNVLSKEQSALSIKMYTEKPRVTFTIVDQLGRIIKTIQAETVLGWNLINWNLPADVASGTYYLVHSENLLKEVLPFMVINSNY
ncbi:right-handed parallel beta-helix repeat-containing protein [Haliscomenobacter sp.]|uniref:right-handed parallel beta-helix repeat-containing protein n=1 Tax=Haliscomenobacter sp. TaxID=2717303 RepID=UPI003BA95010